jgi:pheromone shutdown protein TraB
MLQGHCSLDYLDDANTLKGFYTWRWFNLAVVFRLTEVGSRLVYFLVT